MNYYTVVDKCPRCNNLQTRWIISGIRDTKTVEYCVKCSIPFRLSQNIFQILFENPTE